MVDSSPHYWLTGINCVLDGDHPNHYRFYIQHDYRRYIMDKSYEPIASSALFDFERNYEFVADYEKDAKTITGGDYNDGCIVLARASNGDTYERVLLETDKKQANATTYPTASTIATTGYKIVTGVKHGYGAYNDNLWVSMLYLWHPREYTVALAGYASFVCQNLII